MTLGISTRSCVFTKKS